MQAILLPNFLSRSLFRNLGMISWIGIPRHFYRGYFVNNVDEEIKCWIKFIVRTVIALQILQKDRRYWLVSSNITKHTLDAKELSGSKRGKPFLSLRNTSLIITAVHFAHSSFSHLLRPR